MDDDLAVSYLATISDCLDTMRLNQEEFFKETLKEFSALKNELFTLSLAMDPLSNKVSEIEDHLRLIEDHFYPPSFDNIDKLFKG